MFVAGQLIQPVLYIATDFYLRAKSQHAIRKEQNTKLYSLRHTDLSKAQWVERNEFRYNGEMYDVQNIRVASGRLLIHAYHDVHEGKLFDYLSCAIGQRTEGKYTLTFTTNSFFFFQEPEVFSLCKNYKTIGTIHMAIMILPEVDLVRFSPPPEC